MFVSRRTLLGGVAAAAVAPHLPAMAAAAPPSTLYPIWAVGIEDYPNWRMIAAESLERAIQLFKSDEGGGLCEGCDGLRCAELDPDGECEHAGVTGNAISPKCVAPCDSEGDIGADKADMKNAGWTHNCDRCGYDAPSDWEIVGDEAVCDECMNLEDWDLVNPKYAAELREEQQIEFWEEFAETLQDVFAPATGIQKANVDD